MCPLPLVLLLAAAPVPGADPAGAAASAPAGAAPASSPAVRADAPPPAPPVVVEATPAVAADATLPRPVVERLAQGDRSFLERDFRGALFAYMDAAYLAPTSPVPRVRLGRAYLAMRYPERALEQAEKALALDPASADARKLAEEARAGVRATAPLRAGPAAAPSAAAPSAAPPASSPRVFKYVPEPGEAASPAARPAASARTAAPAVPIPAPPVPTPGAAAAVTAASAATAPPPTGSTATPASAAERYREGVDLLQKREFDKALVALDDAVAKDPRLAVAHAARASARFGLGRYREAAEDYRTAIGLDAKLGTPLFGLAECYRVLGDTKNAADMYRRYAESRAADVREDLRAVAAKRAQELK